jgi:ABC-type Fe3+-hydroxamate transport system substrate-binding protein
MLIQDQLKRKLLLDKTPKRIISLVPSQTELMVDLGLSDSLFGLTKFCVHPEHLLKEKLIVGGTKNLRIEKIKTLRPDIILCNKEENTEEMVLQLEKIAPVHVSDIKSVSDSLELINQYGEIFSVSNEAGSLINRINLEMNSFKDFIQQFHECKVAYLIWKDPWMVAGGDTFINELLQLNNFKNIFKDTKRYPEVTLDLLNKVDYILLSSEPFPFQEKHIPELLAYIPAEKIKFVDGEFFSWYGSRLEKAFRYFKKWHLAENILQKGYSG